MYVNAFKKLGTGSKNIQFKNKKKCFLKCLLYREPILFRTSTPSLFCSVTVEVKKMSSVWLLCPGEVRASHQAVLSALSPHSARPCGL